MELALIVEGVSKSAALAATNDKPRNKIRNL
jgi:hypothetical protein